MTSRRRTIRPTSLPHDGEQIMAVFQAAKAIMVASGNTLQWAGDYPTLTDVTSDVERGGSFVVEDDGCVVGYFAFLPSPEPTYARIYGGAWLDEELSYHVIHRIASVPEAHGVFASIISYCRQHDPHLRIDTHRDNLIMRHLIEKNGFLYCGIILLASGDERLAYELKAEEDGEPAFSTPERRIE